MSQQKLFNKVLEEKNQLDIIDYVENTLGFKVITNDYPVPINDKISAAQKAKLNIVKDTAVNYCVDDVMAKCNVPGGATWAQQQKCKYSDKSSYYDRCMWFKTELDGVCDCSEAQYEMRNNCK